MLRAPAPGLLLISLALLAGCARTHTEVRRTVTAVERDAARAARQEEKRSTEIIWRIRTDNKVVALTLDDGPDPRYTPIVLKLARDRNAKLTFFLVGREIQLHPALARQEVAEGHVIGNHTWDHPRMMGESFHQDISEIERCEDEIEKVCGERTHLFRPPKGLWDGDTFLAAADLGYRIVLWSVALEHHTAKTPQAMADRVLGKVRPGMIILAHDGEPSHPVNRDLTMKALPLLMDGLRRKGYRMVTIPELVEIARQRRRSESS